MRHFFTMMWGNLVGLMGLGLAIVWLAVCGIMVLSPAVYTVLGVVKSVFEVYKKRIQEVDEWIADEDVDGLLQNDTYLEISGKFEKSEVRRR